jgi:hypothetical protein
MTRPSQAISFPDPTTASSPPRLGAVDRDVLLSNSSLAMVVLARLLGRFAAKACAEDYRSKQATSMRSAASGWMWGRTFDHRTNSTSCWSTEGRLTPCGRRPRRLERQLLPKNSTWWQCLMSIKCLKGVYS